jgi:hypothetical protein
MVYLHLDFVLELACLFKEIFVFYWIREIFIVFSQQSHFAVADPIVELVAHRVLSPNATILASLQQVQLVNFFV